MGSRFCYGCPRYYVRCCKSIIQHPSLLPGRLLRLQLRQQSLEGILPSKPEERREIHHDPVEDDEAAKDAKVAPDVRVVDAEAAPELVARGVLAELADAVGADLDVAAGALDVGARVGLAG